MHQTHHSAHAPQFFNALSGTGKPPFSSNCETNVAKESTIFSTYFPTTQETVLRKRDDLRNQTCKLAWCRMHLVKSTPDFAYISKKVILLWPLFPLVCGNHLLLLWEWTRFSGSWVWWHEKAASTFWTTRRPSPNLPFCKYSVILERLLWHKQCTTIRPLKIVCELRSKRSRESKIFSTYFPNYPGRLSSEKVTISGLKPVNRLDVECVASNQLQIWNTSPRKWFCWLLWPLFP